MTMQTENKRNFEKSILEGGGSDLEGRKRNLEGGKAT